MRIRISQEPTSSGPKIIPVIPEYRVGLLEGANGIGKSLAVRLLQLVTGDQPWDDPLLWKSLRSALRPADVTVSVAGLTSGKTLEARITPDSWPDDPPPISDDSIATISIDGESASVAEAASLLQVVSFSATEDLKEVARREVSREALTFGLLERAVVPRFDELRAQSGALAEILRDADPAERSVVEARIGEAQTLMAAYEAELTGLSSKRDEVGKALELSKALAGEEQVPKEARGELQELGASIAEAEVEIADIEKDLSRLLKTMGKRGDAEAVLEKAEKTHLRRTNTLRTRREALRATQDRMDLEGELAEETLRELAKEAKERLRGLEADKRGLGAGSRLLTVIDELAPPLDAIIDEGLGDQILLRVGGSDLSATGLRSALRQREHDIAESKPAIRAAEIDEEIAAASRRLSDVQELRHSWESVLRAENNLKESDREVAVSWEAVSAAKGDLEEYNALTGRRDHAADRIRKAAEREVEIRRGLGLPRLRSRSDMEQELSATLADHGISESDLSPRYQEFEERFAEVRQGLSEARREIEVAKRDRDQAHSRIRFAMRQIESDPELADLRRALAGLVSQGSNEIEAIETLAIRSRQVTSELNIGVQELEAVRVVLEEISTASSKTAEAKSSQDTLRGAIYAALDDRLQRRLSAASIRGALFEGEPLESVSLEARTVTWGGSGSMTTRPMESFSTGEQAFAFTQARILALEKRAAEQDRLLVLDEFGAFVSANRRGQLAKFLAGGPVRERASQVLVILPLRANYEQELPETRGKLRQLYERRIDQLSKQGYITEAFRDEAVDR